MELLTIINCLAARGRGGYCSARPNPSIIGVHTHMHMRVTHSVWIFLSVSPQCYF